MLQRSVRKTQKVEIRKKAVDLTPPAPLIPTDLGPLVQDQPLQGCGSTLPQAQPAWMPPTQCHLFPQVHQQRYAHAMLFEHSTGSSQLCRCCPIWHAACLFALAALATCCPCGIRKRVPSAHADINTCEANGGYTIPSSSSDFQSSPPAVTVGVFRNTRFPGQFIRCARGSRLEWVVVVA